MHLLEKIDSPQALKALDAAKLPALCAEIREFLIENVSRTGGHLSSNLGTVELTVALHRVFDSPQDEFIWDVGHQCYTHKILTGRAGGFAALRQQGGLSGFPSPGKANTISLWRATETLPFLRPLALRRQSASAGNRAR